MGVAGNSFAHGELAQLAVCSPLCAAQYCPQCSGVDAGARTIGVMVFSPRADSPAALGRGGSHLLRRGDHGGAGGQSGGTAVTPLSLLLVLLTESCSIAGQVFFKHAM